MVEAVRGGGCRLRHYTSQPVGLHSDLRSLTQAKYDHRSEALGEDGAVATTGGTA